VFYFVWEDRVRVAVAIGREMFAAASKSVFTNSSH